MKVNWLVACYLSVHFYIFQEEAVGAAAADAEVEAADAEAEAAAAEVVEDAEASVYENYYFYST